MDLEREQGRSAFAFLMELSGFLRSPRFQLFHKLLLARLYDTDHKPYFDFAVAEIFFPCPVAGSRNLAPICGSSYVLAGAAWSSPLPQTFGMANPDLSR